MHSFILLADELYTIDTKAERELAANRMCEAGVSRLAVYRGGPDGTMTHEGRDLCSDGLFAYWDQDNDVCRYCRRGNSVCTCE